MTRNGHAGANEIRKDIDALRADFAALTKDIDKMRRNGAHGIQEKVEAQMADAKERLTSTAESLVSDAEEQITFTRQLFKDHPLATIGGAFGLGLLAAKLLR